MTGPVELAHELVARGARLVVVGGTARHLLGAARPPRDLDVAVAEQDVEGLASALSDLGCLLRTASLLRVRTLRVLTGWGPLDVFVADGLPVVEIGGLQVAA